MTSAKNALFATSAMAVALSLAGCGGDGEDCLADGDHGKIATASRRRAMERLRGRRPWLGAGKAMAHRARQATM